MAIKHVLLVDDESVVRLTTSLLLKKLGVEVTAMEDGNEAFRFYTENADSIDLVILDNHMPEISGLELFQKLKEFDNSVHAVISSGFLDDDEIQEFEGIGIAGILNKPFNIAQLEKVIKGEE